MLISRFIGQKVCLAWSSGMAAMVFSPPKSCCLCNYYIQSLLNLYSFSVWKKQHN